MTFLMDFPLDKTPPEISREVHRIVRETIGSRDPYKEVKRKSNEMAKNIFPDLKRIVEDSKDPLLTSVKLTIAGNAIDFGTMRRFDVNDVIEGALNRDIDIKTFQKFKEDLNRGEKILYLADNAGEIFFDRILIEEISKLRKHVTYVVKTNPIINDATLEDAKVAGIDKISEVIAGDENQRYSAPGFIINSVSDDFMRRFREFDVIIAKGQGNYEALSEVDRRVYFLLLIKCPLVARDLKGSVGDYVIRVNL